MKNIVTILVLALLALLTGCFNGAVAPLAAANPLGRPGYGQPPMMGTQIAPGLIQPTMGMPGGYGMPGYGPSYGSGYGGPMQFGMRPPCTSQFNMDDICAQQRLAQSGPPMVGPTFAPGSGGPAPITNPPANGQPTVAGDISVRVNNLEAEIGAQGAVLETTARRVQRAEHR